VTPSSYRKSSRSRRRHAAGHLVDVRFTDGLFGGDDEPQLVVDGEHGRVGERIVRAHAERLGLLADDAVDHRRLEPTAQAVAAVVGVHTGVALVDMTAPVLLEEHLGVADESLRGAFTGEDRPSFARGLRLLSLAL